MSSKENPCRKFQANIFNKSKCQNCFKPRESHLLNDEDLNQAKPIYGGWLLLAPEGTNFDNPLQRSRKWQRRFFVLYEHGLLRYALDEMPSTLPQGTINMNQCSEVRDGEARSGQKNALSILTPEREHFIRAECREIINGWQEILTVYPRTNTQNQKKKRKVEPPTPQEPGPAKVTVTSGGGGVEGGGSSAVAGLWQEEEEERWSRTTVPYSRSASCLSQLAQSHPGPPSAQSHPGPPSAQSHPGLSRSARDDGRPAGGGRKVRVESGYFSLEKTRSEPPPSAPPPHRYQPPDLQLYPSQDPPLASPLPSSSPGVPGALASPLPSSSPGAPGAPLSPSSSAVSSSHSSLDSEPSWDGRGGGGGRLSQGRGGDGGGGGGGGRQGRPGRDGYAALSDVPRARRLSHREAFRSEKRRQELRARTRSPGREEVTRLFGQERRRSQVIGRFESVDGEEQMDTSTEPTSSSLSNEREPASSSLSNEREPASSSLSNERQGRSEKRHLSYQETASSDAGIGRSAPDLSSSFLLNLRRAKSLDRRETSTTPDLLNFKKGWMTKLYDDGTWRKRWFVLTDQSLRFYKDSIAEEAADLDGEIDLSTCYDVTEFPVQRNYGFQILSKEGACTLSAMTSGIRRNWIQAILKSARPAAPPDVTCSVPEEKARVRVVLGLCPQPSPGPGSEAPRVEVHTQRLGASASVTAAPMSDPRKSRVRERRKEGRCKTYDWSEFRPGQAASGEPKRERAETTVGLSSASSSSTAASPSSSSSTTSSLASSPVSTTSSPHTSSSVSAPPLALSPRVFASPVGEEEREGEPAEQEQARLRNERRLCLQQSPPTLVHAARTVTVTMTSTLSEAAAVGGESRAPEESSSREPIGMEVDHTALDSRGGGRGGSGRPPDVQVEIEQRWHQVETTPLREEKQVPIATTPDPAGIDRPPQQDLTALLDKELGQTQKELAKLHKQNSLLQEQLQDARGREQHARDGYVLQATCERGFVAMEETHHKVVEDLQRQHQREVCKLLEERERLLAEETAATISAIEAMKNAHREELEKTQRSQLSGLSSDINELRLQYEEELQSIHRELEVLSEQYSQKCLENAHLSQALEAERQALRQCQRENQELNAHNQELNNRLTAEISRIRSSLSAESGLTPLTQGKDLYELEVLLRVKESEIQYLKQEIHSLKDELQSAFRDKKYATDKYKDIYTELSIVKAKVDCDISKLKEKLLAATEALGGQNLEGTVAPGYDIMKSKSNPDFLKKERSALSKQSRGIRSKSLKEGLTVQERMKLFEAKDSRKI